MTGLQDAGVEQLYDGEADRGAEIQRLNGVRDSVMSPTLRDSVMSPTLRDSVMSPTPTLIQVLAGSMILMGCVDPLRRGVSTPNQCPLGSVASYLIYADVRTFR